MLRTALALTLAASCGILTAQDHASDWRAHLFTLDQINVLRVGASDLAAHFAAASQPTAATLSAVKGASSFTVLPSMTTSGLPVTYTIPAQTVIYVLSQAGVVSCQIVPTYDSSTGKTSVAILGLKADGSIAVTVGDDASSCPPACGK